MPGFDSSPACLPRLRLSLPVPVQPPGRPLDAREVSRFSRVQFLDVRTALGLRRACRQLALSFPAVWPSRGEHSVGARDSFFEARFLARRCLCLHFTRHLTAPSARLEVKMVRYSFLVGLFHPRLHAGLSRRLRSLTFAALMWGRPPAVSRILCKHSRELMFRAGYTGCTRAEDRALRRRNLSAGSAAGIRRDRAQLVPASSNPGGKAQNLGGSGAAPPIQKSSFPLGLDRG
jgi:hypothetical protein